MQRTTNRASSIDVLQADPGATDASANPLSLLEPPLECSFHNHLLLIERVWGIGQRCYALQANTGPTARQLNQGVVMLTPDLTAQGGVGHKQTLSVRIGTSPLMAEWRGHRELPTQQRLQITAELSEALIELLQRC